ncbi:vWA domain-containing protein [Oceaniglobus roseus]|uniref:vWA domain-containing protein n=1 Tax=Oceaniglobus roseus TaxID=1737570 RepID=UPI000C7F39C2|nr:VWA domain-containing protein [Kandeliimicrobium roseum]
MSGLAEIVLLRPWWLLAVPVVVALAVVRLLRTGGLGDWQARIDPHLMAAMRGMGRVDLSGARLGGWPPFAMAALVALALTGPALPRRDAQTFRNLDGVVFVMDLSASMTRDATWPKTVTMARAALSVLGTKPAALIVYSGDSYLASPLTTDRVQMGQTISLLDDETIPDRGNRPALALDQAADLLERAGILAGDVILFTDGAGLGPEAMAAAGRIAGRGARLSVVGAETAPHGAPVDPQALARLAEAGQGAVYGVDDTARIMADFGRQDDPRLERQDLKLLFLRGYGRILLLLALIPAALLFRREAA